MEMMEANREERKWRNVGLALFCLLVVVGIRTVPDYGMGWDEPTRWRSGDAKVAYYQELISSENRAELIHGVGPDRYPGLFDMSLSLLHQWTGWDRFLLGHYWAWGFGLVGLLALWFAAKRLGGAKLAFWASLFLVLTPSFYGHWFHNPKDIPFAATYMLALAALLRIADVLPEVRWRSILLFGSALGLVLSVRIAGLVMLGYFACLLGFFFIRAWAGREESGMRSGLGGLLETHGKSLGKLILVGLGSAGVGLIILLVWWPAGHKNIFSASGSTFQALHTSASDIPLLFRGRFYQSADTPFYYAVWMTAVKSPESLLILLGAATAALVGGVRKGPRRFLARLSLPWAVVALGGLFPLAYLSVTAPALHNGVRHFLFIFPPLCILAAGGWLWLLECFPLDRAYRVGLIVRLLIPGLLLVQAFQLAALHPYQYVYHNALAGGPSGSYGHYETEYWFTSTRHGLEWLEENVGVDPGDGPVRIFVTGPWQVAEPFLPDGMRLTSDLETADYLLVNTQMLMDQQIEGRHVHVIERMGLPILYIRTPIR